MILVGEFIPTMISMALFRFYLAADTRRQLPTIFRPGDSARPKPAIAIASFSPLISAVTGILVP